MESQIAIILNLLLVILMGFSRSSQARTFYVGGKAGWVTDPSENYIHWAERNRFQINDSLIFKYKQDLDSVLEVSEEDYYKCNKGKPLQTLKDGASEFKIQRSGPFYFISGYDLNCERGQKLIVVVLSPRWAYSKGEAPSPAAKTSTPPSPSPSPVSPAPPPLQAKSPLVSTYEESHHHLAPAPAPSSATSVYGGNSIFSFFLEFSLTVTVTVVLSCLV